MTYHLTTENGDNLMSSSTIEPILSYLLDQSRITPRLRDHERVVIGNDGPLSILVDLKLLSETLSWEEYERGRKAR